MKSLSRAALTMAILVCSSLSLAAPRNLCVDPKKTHQLEASTTGEVIEGPACIQVKVNALRYSAELVKTITFTAGPSLTSVLPEEGKAAGAECKITKAVTLEDAFQQIADRVNGRDCDGKPLQGLDQQLKNRQADNRTDSALVDTYLAKLKDTVIQSDEILKASGAPAVVNLVNSKSFQDDLKNAFFNASSWKTTDENLKDIQDAQAKLAALPQQFGRPVSGAPAGPNCATAAWQEWFTDCKNESRYKLLQDQLAKLETDALQMATGSEEAQKIAKKAGLLNYWKNLISGLGEPSFIVQTEADCGVLFNKNKLTAIKLVLTDRIPLFDAQTPQPQVKDPLVTVECGSPFSISAGVGFSTIEDREFSLVKSTPSDGGDSVLRFGESTRSPVHPMPLAMAHARVLDWDSNKYALHASFGVAAAIKGQNSGGSNAEYLTGLSVSFLRTIYLTGGVHIGQQASLAGGFKVGDIVPADITEPPVQKGFKVGFGFAVTFTKP
jgi:hypothetical protein